MNKSSTRCVRRHSSAMNFSHGPTKRHAIFPSRYGPRLWRIGLQVLIVDSTDLEHMVFPRDHVGFQGFPWGGYTVQFYILYIYLYTHIVRIGDWLWRFYLCCWFINNFLKDASRKDEAWLWRTPFNISCNIAKFFLSGRFSFTKGPGDGGASFHKSSAQAYARRLICVINWTLTS